MTNTRGQALNEPQRFTLLCLKSLFDTIDNQVGDVFKRREYHLPVPILFSMTVHHGRSDR